jgi:hypothetical protein
MHCQFALKARESKGLGLKLMHEPHAFSCSIDMHSQHQREGQKIGVKKPTYKPVLGFLESSDRNLLAVGEPGRCAIFSERVS